MTYVLTIAILPWLAGKPAVSNFQYVETFETREQCQAVGKLWRSQLKDEIGRRYQYVISCVGEKQSEGQTSQPPL